MKEKRGTQTGAASLPPWYGIAVRPLARSPRPGLSAVLGCTMRTVSTQTLPRRLAGIALIALIAGSPVLDAVLGSPAETRATGAEGSDCHSSEIHASK